MSLNIQFNQCLDSHKRWLLILPLRLITKTLHIKKIPANLDIADFNNSNIVLSDSREAMNAEIGSLKQKSAAIISSVDFHKEMITCFDRILTELNPELAEKQQQQSEINSLKNQVGEMSKSITELMELNRELMLQLKKE